MAKLPQDVRSVSRQVRRPWIRTRSRFVFEEPRRLYHGSIAAFNGGRIEAEKLQKSWKEACAGMEFALNFMKNNVGIDSPALLSSPFLLITLAYYGHKRGYSLKSEESQRLRYWILAANAK